MKMVIPGKAKQVQECVDFAIERCKAHGFSLNCEQTKQDDRFSVSSGNGVFALTFSIYQVGNDLIVESKTWKCLVLTDPAPQPSILPFPFGNIVDYAGNKLLANRILKTIHSEIEHRFS